MNSSEDTDEKCANDLADEVIEADKGIEEFFESLFSRYYIGLETSMKGSELQIRKAWFEKVYEK